MGTTVATLTPSSPEPIYHAVRGQHEGLSLLIVFSKKEDNAPAFCASSVESALPRLQDDPTWAACLRKSAPILVSVDNGRPFQDRAVPDLIFYGLMINMPEWNPFKTKACILLRDAGRGKATAPDDVADDPIVQSMKRDYELAIRTARAARDAIEAKEIALRVDRKVDSSLNQIEDLRDDFTFRKDRAFTIAGLAHRGWVFDSPELRKKVGAQCAEIAKEWGDVVPKEMSGRYPENLHKPETFNRWEKWYGDQYRATCYRAERDHYRQKR